jgi:hypothetical protein
VATAEALAPELLPTTGCATSSHDGSWDEQLLSEQSASVPQDNARWGRPWVPLLGASQARYSASFCLSQPTSAGAFGVTVTNKCIYI